MKKPALSFILILLCNHLLPAQCKLDYSNYHVVFDEEFNYSNVNELKGKWNFNAGDPNFGWGVELFDQDHISLLPGGFLRLKAKKIKEQSVMLTGGQQRTVNYRSGMLQSNVPFDPGGWPGNIGFTYGMFEIKVKLPKGITGVWPAFWIYSGPTEIDIFDNLTENPARIVQTNVINWKPNPKKDCGQRFINTAPADYSFAYNIFTAVWTPTRVTFFINGRETNTIDTSTVMTHPFPVSIILSMQMAAWAPKSAFMDVDYIKVYKPNNNDYTLPYKSSYANINKDISATSPKLSNVHAAQGSIAYNPENPDEIFYRGADDRLYRAYKTDGEWKVEQLERDEIIKGDINYIPKHRLIVYKGKDNTIQYVGYSNGWSHGVIDIKGTSDSKVSPKPGSIAIGTNGSIFYKGKDNKVHEYYHNGTGWVNRLLPHKYQRKDFVKGDIIAGPQNQIFYKGRNNMIHAFLLKDSLYAHNNLGEFSSSYMVSNKPGSMAISNEGIFYIGSDNKIHRFYLNNNWIHELLPYNYGNPSTGFLKADYAKGNIAYDHDKKMVIYGGYDGRIQYLENRNNSWNHTWLDDYWDTNEFTTYGQKGFHHAKRYPSIKVSSSNMILYSRKNGHLAFFKWAPCEKLITSCQ
jgi:hypothetical protein